MAKLRQKKRFVQRNIFVDVRRDGQAQRVYAQIFDGLQHQPRLLFFFHPGGAGFNIINGHVGAARAFQHAQQRIGVDERLR